LLAIKEIKISLVANLERNLYLTVQMMELGANLVLALNMNKFATEKGIKNQSKETFRTFRNTGHPN